MSDWASTSYSDSIYINGRATIPKHPDNCTITRGECKELIKDLEEINDLKARILELEKQLEDMYNPDGFLMTLIEAKVKTSQ